MARQAGVAWTARDEGELVEQVSRLLQDVRLREEVARRAQQLITEQQGASQRTVEMVRMILSPD
jgi:3-deoxy-D-manno-octulosonic-acid transferase